MEAKREVLIKQLRHTCRLTEAGWGVFLYRSMEAWQIEFSYGLRKDQLPFLVSFLKENKIKSWLDDAAVQRRFGYRSIPDDFNSLEVERSYAIPSRYPLRILLVGANYLKKSAIDFFATFTQELPKTISPTISKEFPPEQAYPAIGDLMELPVNLQRILETILNVVESEHAVLAVRSGDKFIVNAAVNLPTHLVSTNFLVEPTSQLGKMIQKHQVHVVKYKPPIELEIEDFSLPDMNWLVAPIPIGQRVIGIFVFGRDQEFNDQEIDMAAAIGGHVAPSIERSILNVEAAYYLQRFALLNDLASLASSGLELNEVVLRGEELLQRSFSANSVKVLLYDEQTNMFVEYLDSKEKPAGRRIDRGLSLERSVMEIGQVLRIGEVAKLSHYVSSGRDVSAKMVVPMNFRGKVIGVVSLESYQIGAFSDQDEKFITVVASQMASIVMSIRLNSEMRRRANDMLSVNEIVQEILGLAGDKYIAEYTAHLMAQKFDYEMILVMLLDPELEELIAEGVAGTHVADVPLGFRFAKNLGIPGEVMRFGESVILTDVRESASYVPIPGWEPGSGIWVPLRDGGKVFGVVSVEYQQQDRVDENDLVVIEAIAGILSSVLTNARQYEQLQRNVRQLEAVRATALDIGTNLDLEILLKRVVNRVRTLVDARGAELGFVEDNGESVQVLVSENPWQDYTGYRFPFMAGVTGRVAATGKPLAIEDFNAWEGRKDSVFRAPFSTVAGVPLKLMGEVIGTLVVQDDRPIRSFTKEDIYTLELLSPQLAIFIRNARLYQELEERMNSQRLAEERLVRSAKLAAVGEMAAAVAHELNNPLTTVTGFTELILEDLSEDSPEFEDMSLVLSEAQRSREVVRRLLDFSRQSEILRVDTDLNEMVTMVLQLTHHLAQTSNIKVRMELWEDIPMIRADRNQIQQVILNLVHNAIQSMPEGGELIVQSVMEERENQTWLGIRVQDHGIGIEEEHLDKIFEPFFTTKPGGEGTGLGLSVSYSIISEHGGYIDVKSKIKEGSVFTIWLPAINQSEVKE
ncbi:MAG: GAF domain-containing protein [candidate division Zixibacteria bacterium]|nr:GAF domain-containing protein [Gammaproteobacteria bacterium]NIX55842.1 GAF domain-containing protein [candidate division Zixibacteria bacterium]